MSFFANLFSNKDKDKDKDKDKEKPKPSEPNVDGGDIFSGMTIAPVDTPQPQEHHEPQPETPISTNFPDANELPPEPLTTTDDSSPSAFSFLNDGESDPTTDPALTTDPQDANFSSSFDFVTEDNFPPPPGGGEPAPSPTPITISTASILAVTSMSTALSQPEPVEEISPQQNIQKTLPPAQGTKGKKIIRSKRPGQAAQAAEEPEPKNKHEQLPTQSNAPTKGEPKSDAKSEPKIEQKIEPKKEVKQEILPKQQPAPPKTNDKNTDKIDKNTDKHTDKNDKNNDKTDKHSDKNDKTKKSDKIDKPDQKHIDNDNSKKNSKHSLKNGKMENEIEEKESEIPISTPIAATSETVELRMKTVWDVVQQWQSQADSINEQQGNMLLEKKKKNTRN